MRKSVLMFIFLVALFLTGCTEEESLHFNSSYDSLSVTGYNSLEEIYERSEIVAEVELTGESKEVIDQSVSFTLSEVLIKDVLVGDADIINENINILELTQINMAKYEDGKNFILFLHPYNGDTFENSYFISGVYQGKFKLDRKNNLIYDAGQYGGHLTFQRDLNELSIGDFKNKLDELAQ